MAAAFALVVGCSVSGSSATGAVELTVATSDGGSPGDFRVEWQPEPGSCGSVLRAGDSYRYNAVPEGTYTLTVTAPGYAPDTTTVEVEPGTTAAEQVTLGPAE